MSMGESAYDRINDYGTVKIGLASPYDIRSWSFGEVKRPETINYRTYRPEKDGLFCERIFGPEKDWECACGKYRGMTYKGMNCDHCGVKVTHSRVRRERMGHIELAAPVVHIWFFKAMPGKSHRAIPSRLGALLDMKISHLERIIYFQDYVVVEPGDTPLKERQLLSEEEFRKAGEEYGDTFHVDTGAEAIRKLLMRLDLASLSRQLRDELAETTLERRLKDLTKRLRVVEALRDSDNRAEWMVLECVPVIPPHLRPLVLLDSGNFATSDLNDLYRRIINRNNRLKKLIDLNAPEVYIRNEKRMLQQAVDALFDNNRCRWPVLGSSNRPLMSLTDMIKGNRGRLRENLLGKRVDYSARSVIVVGPDLKLHQCGLPKEIALELYQPFIIRRLRDLGHAETIKSSKQMLERRTDEVWDALDEVIRNHPVLLNRAPTLHRMGIQAFEPVLVEGKAIQVHPLVCKGFNADFDGDQMAVHLPLSIEAQVEAMTLMMATSNIFSPANGEPIIGPTQDIVMGLRFLTMARPTTEGNGPAFASPNEVFLALSQKKVSNQTPVRFRLPANRTLRGEGEGEHHPGMVIRTTVGRVIFDDILHPKMPFYNMPLGQRELQGIIADCHRILGQTETVSLLDRMKDLGFRESTRSGLSFGIDDLKTLASTDATIAGAVVDQERNHQAAQGPAGANFGEGLSALEYLAFTRDARKSLAETALRTADSGYLTRKLADAAQNVVVTIEDCGTSRGVAKGVIYKGDKTEVSLARAIRGRVSRADIVDPTTGETVVRDGEMITPAAARKLEEMGIEKIQVRGPMTCEAPLGVCRRCYGMDLATGRLVEIGMAVGVIAAQSIGEPGARLIGGLPRVTEMFEARRPEDHAAISEINGRVEILEEEWQGQRIIIVRDENGIEREHLVPSGKRLLVRDFDRVRAGDALAKGPIAPRDILRVRGEKAVQQHLLHEIQNVYRSGGIETDDKHVEIIIALMLRKVRVDALGDTGLLPGSIIDRFEFRRVNSELADRVKIKDPGDTDYRVGDIVPRTLFEEENLRVETEGGKKAEWIHAKPASASPRLLGVTGAAARSDSFITEASFQETTRILTEAALAGKSDHLIGLRENVILGRLIPAGTGFKAYHDAKVRLNPAAVWTPIVDKAISDALYEYFFCYYRYYRAAETCKRLEEPDATGDQRRPTHRSVDPPAPAADSARSRVAEPIATGPAGTEAEEVPEAVDDLASAIRESSAQDFAQAVSANGARRASDPDGTEIRVMDSMKRGLLRANMVHALVEMVRGIGSGQVMIHDPLADFGEATDDRMRLVVSFYSRVQTAAEMMSEGASATTPDLVWEVAGPSENWRLIRRRVEQYHHWGVQRVCIVNPESRTVHVYSEDQPDQVLTTDQVLTLPSSRAEFKIQVSRLFDG